MPRQRAKLTPAEILEVRRLKTQLHVGNLALSVRFDCSLHAIKNALVKVEEPKEKGKQDGKKKA